MERLLIMGGGDIAQRALPWLQKRFRVYVLVRSEEAALFWRKAGAIPLCGDLDRRETLGRLAGIADTLLWTAPPETSGTGSRRLLNALFCLTGRNQRPRSIVYISTSGVYGDCDGALVTETRTPSPLSARGSRRLACENFLREVAARHGIALRILRAPGIYAAERLPVERLHSNSPVLHHTEDVFTNHIHADDLARASCLALFRGRHVGIYNVCDNSHLRMGDFYDVLADTLALPHPPRASRADCAARLSPMSLSFMRESRRLVNLRARRELRWHPEYAEIAEGLQKTCAERLKKGL